MQVACAVTQTVFVYIPYPVHGMDQPSAPTFAIIIKTVPAGSDERSNFLGAFSREFHLSQDVSQKVLDSVPVAIFQELNRGQVSDVKPLLKSLSEDFDTQFFITSSSVSALPVLTWPEHPDFDSLDSEQVLSDVEFTPRNRSVACPECEHVLILDQSGKRVTAKKLANIPASDNSGGQEQDGEIPEEDLEEELNEQLDEELEEGVEEEIEEELEELLNEENLSDNEDSSSSTRTTEEPESETPGQQASGEESDASETTMQPEDGTSTDSPSQSSNGSANVFLSGIPDESTDDILDLLTDIRNCSASEAEKLMDRPITPIQNGVSEDQAKELEERFNEIGVTVTIVYK